MNWAVVDLGTNSARLMIACVYGKKVISLYKTIRTIRIGEGMTTHGCISQAAMERAKTALLEFRQIGKEHKANDFLCFATSAVREAGNKDEFLAFINTECGIDIDVVSGDMEALLGFAGCVHGSGGMIDIGGGSTEIVFGSINDVHFMNSFKIGTVRYHQLFPGGDEADAAAFNLAHAHAADTFRDIPDTAEFEFMGIGGTATALAAIDLELKEYFAERVQGHEITLKKAQRLCAMLKGMTKEQRKTLTGLEENRADVIVFGAIILLEFMKAVRAERIIVSDRDNQEGYLMMKLGFK